MTEERMPAAETQRETTTGMSSVLRLMVVANRPLCQRLIAAGR